MYSSSTDLLTLYDIKFSINSLFWGIRLWLHHWDLVEIFGQNLIPCTQLHVSSPLWGIVALLLPGVSSQDPLEKKEHVHKGTDLTIWEEGEWEGNLARGQ